jgi:hypothetical protein
VLGEEGAEKQRQVTEVSQYQASFAAVAGFQRIAMVADLPEDDEDKPAAPAPMGGDWG